MPPRDGTVVMEDARLVFRNFEGREDVYNREGDMNFSVLLDEEVARMMLEDGWNIKFLKPREDDEEKVQQAYLQVSVGFKVMPPKIVMITSGGRTILGEDDVKILDWVDIKLVDLIVRPYRWAVGDKTGIKAYLKSMFITIEEDPLELKYAQDLPSRSGKSDE